jgi:uncharacterized sulfatase
MKLNRLLPIALRASIGVTLIASSAAMAQVPEKPNIVILFADDLGYGDLGSYGHPSIRTPNLDTLAAKGQRWTDFYVAAPVCSPSRGALLTGKLPNRTGLYGRRIGVFFPNARNGMPHEERTLAEALKEEGYATGIVGKWHLGDAPEYLPTRHGFDYWYGLPYSNDMDWADGRNFDELIAMSLTGRGDELAKISAARRPLYMEPEVQYWNVPVMRSRRDGGGFIDELVERPAQQTELTRRATEEAVAFIDRAGDRPFLLYVPYSMPHTPIFRSSAFAGRSRAGRYGDVIEEIDWSVGEIVARLKERGLAERTLVLFTSDNGPWLTMNQHGGSAGLLRHGKGTTFEGGMRVPAIFWWPGALAPGTISDIGSAMDIYVTALALAGAEPTPETDGVDLTATLTLGAPSPRTSIAYYRQGELRAYRHGPWKLHLVTEGAYRQPPERAEHDPPLLYHLGEDPGERFDVAARHPEVVAEIQALIEGHRENLQEKPPLFDARMQGLADQAE